MRHASREKSIAKLGGMSAQVVRPMLLTASPHRPPRIPLVDKHDTAVRFRATLQLVHRLLSCRATAIFARLVAVEDSIGWAPIAPEYTSALIAVSMESYWIGSGFYAVNPLLFG